MRFLLQKGPVPTMRMHLWRGAGAALTRWSRAGYFGPKDEFRGLIDFSFKKVEKALESHKPRNECCIVHGDVCEQNILVNNYVPILIDWESVGFGDPAVEIARMFEALAMIHTLAYPSSVSNP